MSLKAKLEAVIYAAEEPVTLAQLAALFAADALEWKAAQEAAAAEQAAEVAGQPPQSADFEPLLEAGPAAESPEPPATAEESAAAGEPAGESAPAAAEPGDAESEIRRQARQRDRDIRGAIKQLLDELIVSYASDDRGIEIREIAGGYRMATKPECHDAVRGFVKSLKPPLKLSLPALETLAVVAYKQPVTAPEVNDIRGVESGGVLGSLLARKLIATAGRKQVIGRPILYKTTKEFLLRFGLKDLAELPSMEEFEKMAAAEIEEMEPEAAAADAAEAPSGDMVEESSENQNENESDREILQENSRSGEEMASELAEEAAASSNESASLPAEAATPSNEPETGPAGAKPATAENEIHSHAKEEEER